jgi:pimeloyl-ACP methyl ester carboxylesterase
MQRAFWAVVAALLCLAPTAYAEDRSAAERGCIDRGWARLTVPIEGRERRALWKAPQGSWRHGAIVVMHGGGGQADQWCHASVPLVATQVAFAEEAVAQGFAVFTLQSTDAVTDTDGRACGKVWDDEVRDRPNLDLPFVEVLLKQTIPGLRPAGSGRFVFLTGLSSGGYMTVRAATRFSDLVTAFAPVSSGDPYGWHRICDKSLSARQTVFGIGVDNETGRQIVEEGSCTAPTYPNEKPWDSRVGAKPPFKLFHHEKDGVNDMSCNDKVWKQLVAHGYPDAGRFVLRDAERRRLVHHFWQSAYTQPMLEFFQSFARK